MAEMDYNGYREALEAEWITKEITEEGSLANIEFDKKFTSVDEIFIKAKDFTPSSGSPTEGYAASRWRVYDFDPATDERITVTLVTPSNWQKYLCQLYWTTRAAGSGNVVWNVTFSSKINSGDNLSTGDTALPNSTVAAPALDILQITDIGEIDAIPSGIQHLRLFRLGADVADTLAVDVGVLGIRLKRAL